jgi:hypothetical protein
MRVLIGCEYSGTVRDAFIKRGHDAMSCDLLPTDAPGPHYQGDIFDVINDGWDLGIFHPPCTYLTNSGVCWLYDDAGGRNEQRWGDMRTGAEFFRSLMNAKIKKIAVENPIPHIYALRLIGRRYTQIVHPYMFGHKEQKSTCLWLKGLPPLKATNNVYDEMMLLPEKERQRLHYLRQSPDRWKLRSTTFQGVADAMADQWGRAGVEWYSQKELF